MVKAAEKPTDKPKRRGRPRKQVDEKTLRALAKINCTREEMAAVLGVSTDTLARNYAELIKEESANGKMSLRRMQWKKALEGNITMLIWLGKNELGQRDQPEAGGEQNTDEIAALLATAYEETCSVSE